MSTYPIFHIVEDLNLRFLLYLRNTRRFSPQDIPSIRSIIETQFSTTKTADFVIKNVRVSNTEIQLDIFIFENAPEEVQEEIATKVAAYLEKSIGPLNEKINLSRGLVVELSEPSIIERVVESFNHERYWEGQEIAEAIWNKTPDPDQKEVVQGVILVGAALVHHQRNEDDVCLSILNRALVKLQAFDRIPIPHRSFLSIDIESLRKDVRLFVAERKVRAIKLIRIKNSPQVS